MQNVVPMHVFRALHKLAHVKLYVTWGQFDTLIFQQAGKIVVHVRKNHVHRNGRTLASNDDHINNVDDARVLESFENLNFSKGSDRHSLLLVMHENSLEGDDFPCGFLDRFVDLTKCPFPQLCRNVVIMNRTATRKGTTVG